MKNERHRTQRACMRNTLVPRTLDVLEERRAEPTIVIHRIKIVANVIETTASDFLI